MGAGIAFVVVGVKRAGTRRAWSQRVRDTVISDAWGVRNSSSLPSSSPPLPSLASLHHPTNMADSANLKITMLGAGQEVGRSCCVLQYRGRTIVCDTGIHPAHTGMASLPFIDDLDWSTVDAILITQ